MPRVKPSEKKWKVVTALAVATFAFGALVWYQGWWRVFLPPTQEPVPTPESAPESTECPDCLPRALDGVLVPPAESNLRPLAVMIENHFDAWPQAGLADAQLVYEAVTEGAISRFLAIFSAEQPGETIGPVRSARPYFIDFAEEVGALYVHSGGSDAALAKAKQSTAIDDLNEFWAGRFFWRSPSRNAPHNLYTSTTLLRAALDAYDLPTAGSVPPWQFTDTAALPTAAAQASSIAFNYSPSPTYQVTWHYDAAAGGYVRWQSGAEHLMADGRRIVAQNIIFQFTATQTLDAIGRKAITTRGSGEAWILQAGRLDYGRWAKGATDQRTRFTDSTGAPVQFLRGTTWVEVVPIGTVVTLGE